MPKFEFWCWLGGFPLTQMDARASCHRRGEDVFLHPGWGGRWMLWQVAASTACWVGLVSESVCYATRKFYWGLCFAVSWANSKLRVLNKKWIMIFLESIFPVIPYMLAVVWKSQPPAFSFVVLLCRMSLKNLQESNNIHPSKTNIYINPNTLVCCSQFSLLFHFVSGGPFCSDFPSPRFFGEKKSLSKIWTPPVCWPSKWCLPTQRPPRHPTYSNHLSFGVWLVCFLWFKYRNWRCLFLLTVPTYY